MRYVTVERVPLLQADTIRAHQGGHRRSRPSIVLALEQAHLRGILHSNDPACPSRAMLAAHEGDPRQVDGVVALAESAYRGLLKDERVIETRLSAASHRPRARVAEQRPFHARQNRLAGGFDSPGGIPRYFQPWPRGARPVWRGRVASVKPPSVRGRTPSDRHTVIGSGLQIE